MINNEVGAIFVRPQYQQQGIGSQLMDFVYEIYRELEVEVFKKNIIGQAFYFKYGFETIGEYLHEGSKEIMLRMKYKSHL
jgi:ribosomal protein S18 acetylase RimI-like enzyme